MEASGLAGDLLSVPYETAGSAHEIVSGVCAQAGTLSPGLMASKTAEE